MRHGVIEVQLDCNSSTVKASLELTVQSRLALNSHAVKARLELTIQIRLALNSPTVKASLELLTLLVLLPKRQDFRPAPLCSDMLLTFVDIA